MVEKLKRICFFNPVINVKRPISSIMNLLKEKNYKVSLIIPRRKLDNKRKSTRYYDDFRGIKLYDYPVWTSSSGYAWPIPISMEFLKKTWKILRENDIIHLWVPFYPNSLIICLLKLLFFKKKTLILTMDTFPSYSFKLSSLFDPIFKIFYRTIGKLSFIASNYITIYGESMIKYAKKAGLPSNKIVITPTGINLRLKDSNLDIREELKLNQDVKIVLFIGLINFRKGVDTILRTARLIEEKNIKFILVGDGPERQNLKKLISQDGLQDKIYLMGTRLDVHNFYNQADVFFLPSKGEGLAGVLMEALTYKLPVITSDIAGTRDIITNMENGILCDVEDAHAYSNAIKELLKNESLREKFKANGIKSIKEKFLWKNNIKNFENLYKKARVERKRINVLRLITSSSGGGAQIGVLNYIKNYDKKKYDTFIITLRKGTGNHEEKFQKFGGNHYFSLNLNSRISIKGLLQLRRFIRQNNIKILHTHLIEADLYGFFLKLLLPNLILFTGRHGQNRFRQKLYSGISNYISSIPAKRVVCVSKGLKEYILKNEFIPLRKLKVVYNGIDTSFFKKEDQTQLRKRFVAESGKETIVIGTVGRLKKLKGHEYLFKALHLLKQKGISNIKLLILGEGKHLNNLKELRSKLGLENEIDFLGFKQNIKDYYNIFDIFCLPSNYEGLSNVILEAMATETLVLCSSIPNNLEIIKDGYNGITFKKADYEDLAKKLMLIMEEEVDRNQLIFNARKTVEEDFSIEKSVKNIERIYDKFS